MSNCCSFHDTFMWLWMIWWPLSSILFAKGQISGTPDAQSRTNASTHKALSRLTTCSIRQPSEQFPEFCLKNRVDGIHNSHQLSVSDKSDITRFSQGWHNKTDCLLFDVVSSCWVKLLFGEQKRLVKIDNSSFMKLIGPIVDSWIRFQQFLFCETRHLWDISVKCEKQYICSINSSNEQTSYPCYHSLNPDLEAKRKCSFLLLARRFSSPLLKDQVKHLCHQEELRGRLWKTGWRITFWLWNTAEYRVFISVVSNGRECLSENNLLMLKRNKLNWKERKRKVWKAQMVLEFERSMKKWIGKLVTVDVFS